MYIVGVIEISVNLQSRSIYSLYSGMFMYNVIYIVHVYINIYLFYIKNDYSPQPIANGGEYWSSTAGSRRVLRKFTGPVLPLPSAKRER